MFYEQVQEVDLAVLHDGRKMIYPAEEAVGDNHSSHLGICKTVASSKLR